MDVLLKLILLKLKMDVLLKFVLKFLLSEISASEISETLF